jgi:ADP-ribose pyrophosphatase YjhB (NUDIX family)
MFREVMQFCNKCGNAVVYQEVPGDHVKRYVCSACHIIHYTNPTLVVGALIHHEDKVLLCRRAIEPRYGFWNLPAGYLEDGERSEDGAIRETWEEAGAKIEIEGVMAVYNLPQANQVYIHFLARLADINFTNGEESLETKLFTEDEIPWKDIAFASSTFALKRYFEYRRNNLPLITQIGSFPNV